MKIILVCESFSPKLSGGKAVRFLYKILVDHGHEVKIAITNPFDIKDITIEEDSDLFTSASSSKRFYHRLYALGTSVVPEAFARLVKAFGPAVVHFMSFNNDKPVGLYKFCKQQGIRIVLQPWTMGFYCAQNFGWRSDNDKCKLCISDNFTSAFRHGCIAPLKGSVVQLERAILKRVAIESADIVLSSNSDLDSLLENYGFESQKIIRFPVPFDVSPYSDAMVSSGSYFIFYGQANLHKGIEVLISLFSELPGHELRICPMNNFNPQIALPPNISIFNGVGWGNGLGEMIANARAVLIPSLWSTSTEYSLCEAMAMRKPIIAFNVGVHKDLLIHGLNAMVADSGNLQQFKDAIKLLSSDPELCRGIGDRGAELLVKTNNPSFLHRQLMCAYYSDLSY